MTTPRRSASDWERRRDLLLAAAGLHPASETVEGACQAPRLRIPRDLRKSGRERPTP